MVDQGQRHRSYDEQGAAVGAAGQQAAGTGSLFARDVGVAATLCAKRMRLAASLVAAPVQWCTRAQLNREHVQWRYKYEDGGPKLRMTASFHLESAHRWHTREEAPRGQGEGWQRRRRQKHGRAIKSADNLQACMGSNAGGSTDGACTCAGHAQSGPCLCSVCHVARHSGCLQLWQRRVAPGSAQTLKRARGRAARARTACPAGSHRSASPTRSQSRRGCLAASAWRPGRSWCSGASGPRRVCTRPA